MTRSLPPLTSLRAFEVASRSLSFTKAARELHVTPAAISHQIRGLEQFLGVTLFQRTGRKVELTEHGHLAAEHFREAFDRIARGVQALRPQTREGDLAIGVTPSFATRWLVPRLSGLIAALPNVTLRIRTGTAPVDFDRDEVDVAVASAAACSTRSWRTSSSAKSWRRSRHRNSCAAMICNARSTSPMCL